MRFALLVSIVFLVSCAPGLTGMPADPVLATQTSVVLATESVALLNTPTRPPTKTLQPAAPGAQTKPAAAAAQTKPAGLPSGTYFKGPLSVMITSPLDETVLPTARVELTGEADPETVISIDDQIVLVGAGRKFSVPLTLTEGPNIIEITASDPDGNQDSAYLTVIYDPQP